MDSNLLLLFPRELSSSSATKHEHDHNSFAPHLIAIA